MAASYGDNEMKVLKPGEGDSGWATAIAVEAGTGDITGGLWTCLSPHKMPRLGILITVAIDYNVVTTLAIITFFRRITFGSNTGRVTLGTITIPDGTAAGRVLYKDINDVNLSVGEQVIAAITTAGVGGGAIAGDFLPVVYYDFRPEALGNQTGWVASA